MVVFFIIYNVSQGIMLSDFDSFLSNFLIKYFVTHILIIWIILSIIFRPLTKIVSEYLNIVIIDLL